MINYLPEETRVQVLKNIMYVDNINRVVYSERSRLFNFIMKHNILPYITVTGYIIE